MTKETRRLVAEMSVGMSLYVLALALLAVIFRSILAAAGFSLYPVLLGLAAGLAASVIMLVHMSLVAEKALDSRDEAYANRITVIHSVVRKVVLVAILFLLGASRKVDIVAMALALFGLKAGAFLQPAVHRVFARFRRNAKEYTISQERREAYEDDGASDD